MSVGRVIRGVCVLEGVGVGVCVRMLRTALF